VRLLHILAANNERLAYCIIAKAVADIFGNGGNCDAD